MKTLDEVKQEYLKQALSHPIEPWSIRDANGRVVARSTIKQHHAFVNAQDEAYAAQHYKLSERFKNEEGKFINYYWMEPSEKGLFKSSDGQFYKAADLPETDDTFVKRRYSDTIRAERNARISDTDDYIRLPDITIQSQAKAKRAPLTNEDRAELESYRQALRDMTDLEGFPFVQWPEFPTALAYELQQKVNERNQKRQGGFNA